MDQPTAISLSHTPVAASDTVAAPAPPAEALAGALTEDRVREELKKVIDPELFVNIIDLGLVYIVAFEPVEEGKQKVKIEMTMTSPACPAGPQLIAQSKMVIKQMPGVSDCEVRIVMDPPWTPDKMSEEARDSLGIF
jgi:metal-sulfur cluster biosynthetic enzyme